MPKMKTKKGAAKRFRVTAGGIKFRGAFRAHCNLSRPKVRKLQSRSMARLAPCDVKSALRMLRLM